MELQTVTEKYGLKIYNNIKNIYANLQNIVIFNIVFSINRKSSELSK